MVTQFDLYHNTWPNIYVFNNLKDNYRRHYTWEGKGIHLESKKMKQSNKLAKMNILLPDFKHYHICVFV